MQKVVILLLLLFCFAAASATLVDSSLPDLPDGATVLAVELSASGEVATYAQFINTTQELSIVEGEFVAKAMAYSPSEHRRLSPGSGLALVPTCTLGTTSTPFKFTLGKGLTTKLAISCTQDTSALTLRNAPANHDLIYKGNQWDSVSFFSTDGSDCTGAAGASYSYYTNYAVFGTWPFPTASFTLTSAPCRAATCCTIIKCENLAYACSVSILSTFYGSVSAASPSATPTPSKTPTSSRAASASSTRSRSSTSSRTASVTPSVSRPPSKTSLPTRAAATTTPLATLAAGSDYNPALDTKYAACYNVAVLSQGDCGSCYAHAAATALSIALCRASIDSGIPASSAFQQVSTQWAMAEWIAYSNNCQSYPTKETCGNPCLGGWPESILLNFAGNVHPALGALGGGEKALLTCTSPNGYPCSSGCNPYTASSCPSSDFAALPSGSSCRSLYLLDNACIASASAADTSAVNALTARASKWRVITSVTELSLTTTGSYIEAKPRSAKGDFWFASSPYVPADGWSASDITKVKGYLRTYGPMTVIIAYCQSIADYLEQGPTCGMVGGVRTYSIPDGTKCVSKTPITGFSSTGSGFPDYQYWKPVFPSSASQAYSGPSCVGISAGGLHAVTLLGWRNDIYSASGVLTPSWVIRNSWGVGANNNGDFYLPIATASFNPVNAFSSSKGGARLAQPFGIRFVPKTARQLSDGAWAAADAAAHRRHLQFVESGEAGLSPSGVLADCSGDDARVQRAANVAKEVVDKDAGFSHTNFVVTQLMCQPVGGSTIVKSAVIATDAITGARVYHKITFQDFGSRVVPTTQEKVDPTMATDDKQWEDDGYGNPSLVSSRRLQDEKASGPLTAADSILDAATVAPTTTGEPQTYTVLSHDAVNPSTVSADATFATPLTNPNGMIDPTQALQDFLGVKGNIYIITSGLIAVAIVLVALISYLVYFIVTHRAEMARLAHKVSAASSRVAHALEDRLESALHIQRGKLDPLGCCTDTGATQATLPAAASTTPALVLKDAILPTPLTSSASPAPPATTSSTTSSSSSNAPTVNKEEIYFEEY